MPIPAPPQHDFTCGLKSRNDHKGTDFALPTPSGRNGADAMFLPPRPARAGGARRDARHRHYSADIAADLNGRDCGNGVRLRHGSGLGDAILPHETGQRAVKPGQTSCNPASLWARSE